MDSNFDHQMSLSKSKCWYSNNCLHFFKCAVTLNEKIQYGAVGDLAFYKKRLFSKISFKHCLLNEIKIFKIWLEQCLNDISCIISFKAIFTL